MPEPDTNAISEALSSIQASPRALQVLRDLHKEALTEEPFLGSGPGPLTAARELFVALDPDKCAMVYLLARATGARHVVEAGTSFGLSAIYLALAVGQNVAAASSAAAGVQGKVIATENEPHKAARAREHWQAAGDDEVTRWIDLREGDLRETLKTDLPPQIDLVLLDIWTPMALPALKLVHANLRVGASVVVDNYVASKEGYQELTAFLQDPKNGFKTTTVPYTGGLHVAVYLGSQ